MRTLKDLAHERGDDLLAHDAQLTVPQRVLQHLSHRVVRLRDAAGAARYRSAAARLRRQRLLCGRSHLHPSKHTDGLTALLADYSKVFTFQL